MSTYGLYRLSAKVRYFYTQNVMRVSGERERERELQDRDVGIKVQRRLSQSSHL